MLKLLSSVTLTTLLSFSCTDSPSTETVTTTTTVEPTTTAPTAVTISNTAPIAEGPNELEVEEEENTPVVEESTTATKPVAESAPKEEPIKDKARPRSETPNPEPEATPTPQPAPKTAPAPKNNPPATNKVETVATKPAVPAFSHAKFDALLRSHVSSSGKVDYKGFKKDQAVLADYMNQLKSNAPQSDWSKNKQMAYWINLYNAFTIQTILENYPVKSITDIEGGKVWDRKTVNIGGEKLTLNDIEKKKLLKRFRDGRVHFAVNCAAASCPPLLNKAWTEDNVQRYLSQQTKAFINNATENQLSAKSIQVSQIFNWYADDFGGKDKIVSYFQKYSKTEIKDNAKVSFKEYNWELND